MLWQTVTSWSLLTLALAGTTGQDESRQAFFLSFSVKHQNGIFVRDLAEEEVSLLIDDQPVEIRFFGSENVDLATVLLLENSPRTARFRRSMPQYNQVNVVDAFRLQLMDGRLDRLASRGPVLLAEFYKEWELLEDFSRDAEALTLALHRMEPKVEFLDRENIPVGRMIGRGAELLRRRPEKRKALVVFTTSIDQQSSKDLDEYRDMLRLSDVDLYLVSILPRSTAGPGYSVLERVSRASFAALVNETGGLLYISGDYAYIHELVDDLVSRVENSYTIGFYVIPGATRDGHQVQIRVGRDRCRVSHRETIFY